MADEKDASIAAEWTLPVSVDELERAILRLLDAARGVWGAEVVLTDDFRWQVLGGAAVFDPVAKPDLGLGSLADDVEEMRAMLTRPDDEVYLWHDLNHVIGVFQALVAMDERR